MQTRSEQFHHLIYKFIIYDPESNENKAIIEHAVYRRNEKREMTLRTLGKELITYFDIWWTLKKRYVLLYPTIFLNPIPHGGGEDSALLQIVFFITSVRDAAEPRNLVTFPKL